MKSLAERAFEIIAYVAGCDIAHVRDPVGSRFEGRHDYALSSNEDATMQRIEQHCRVLLERHASAPGDYDIQYDPFGNLYVTMRGVESVPAIAMGSHVDSVMHGGLFDGLSGIAAGLLFLERLVECREKPRVPFMFIAFRSEESSPVTSSPCLGSSIATGQLDLATLRAFQYGLAPAARVPLSAHFSERYGPERWSAVEACLAAPPLDSRRVAYFLEVHPSQGRILQEEGTDLGIVVGGIGGMQNREISLPAEYAAPAALPDPTAVAAFEVRIRGRADHTGSALHNPPARAGRASGARLDALVATAKLVESLCARLPAAPRTWTFARTHPQQATGFTTVPFDQTTVFVCPRDVSTRFAGELDAATTALIEEGFEVTVSASEQETRHTLDSGIVATALRIPLVVEEIAANLAYDDETGAGGAESSRYRGGLVRATVTDFTCAPDRGIAFKLNVRIGEERLGSLLIERLSEAVSILTRELCGKGIDELGRILANYPPSPVDPDAAAELTRLCGELGVRCSLTPSMPAHDVGRLMTREAKIRGSMIFLSDEGGSHVPTEIVRERHMEAGLVLAHTYLAQRLGVTLKGGSSHAGPPPQRR